MNTKGLKCLAVIFPVTFISIFATAVVYSNEKVNSFNSGLSSNPIASKASPDGSLWFYGYKSQEISKIDQEGKVTKYPIPYSKQPLAIEIDKNGAAWAYGDNSNIVIKAFGKGNVKTFKTQYRDNPLEMEVGEKYVWLSSDNSNKITQINQEKDLIKTLSTPLTSNPSNIILDQNHGVWLIDSGKSGSLVYLSDKGEATDFVTQGSVLSADPAKGGVWLSFDNSGDLKFIRTPR